MKRIAIGIIKKSHGIKGCLRVKSLSGEFNHFLRLDNLYTKNGDCFTLYNVQSVKKISSDILLKLNGIDSPEDGNELRGCEIWVDRKYAAPLHKDEFYTADISLCSVYQNEELIGKIKTVFGGGLSDLMEIIDTTDKIIIVPFEKRFVEKVDLKTKKIYLAKDLDLR